MEQLVLFEFIDGYSLFKLNQPESLISVSYDDPSILKKAITLVSNFKFTSFDSAIQNLISLSKISSLPEDLKKFLVVNNVQSLYCDKSLFSLLSELKIKGKQNDSLMRAIRLNISKLVKSDSSFLLGAAHEFSRSKIEYSDKKEDSMIIQSVLVIDQLRLDVEFFLSKIYNLYDFYFPELKDLVEKDMFFELALILNSNENFEQLIGKIKNKYGEEIGQKIFEGVLYSIGSISNKIKGNTELSTADLVNINELLRIAEEKYKILDDLTRYLNGKLEIVAPNLLELVGTYLAGKLIAQAGSLLNLAKAPASTVQLLGAEAALFRALKTRGKTPKHGIIYHSDEVVKSKNKGKVSRILAGKISIAAKIDYFGEQKTNLYGIELKKSLKEILKGKKVDLSEVMANVASKLSSD